MINSVSLNHVFGCFSFLVQLKTTFPAPFTSVKPLQEFVLFWFMNVILYKYVYIYNLNCPSRPKVLCVKETKKIGNDPHKEGNIYFCLIKHFAIQLFLSSI